MDITFDLDYAIVGAGAAGTYAAWRLVHNQDTAKSRIGVFDFLTVEGEPHVGGRLWSAAMPGLGHVRRAELGGMRYLSSQTIVSTLVQQVLKMETVPFAVESRQDMVYLRGQLFRSPELNGSASVPYRLLPGEQGMSPGGLLLYAIECIVPNAPYLTDAEWQYVKENLEVDGYALHNIGLWELLQRVLSDEAYQYVYDGQGYNSVPNNWNAAEAMQWMLADFGANTSYLYAHAGYQDLPKTLLAQAQKEGVTFHHPHRLLSWEPIPDQEGGGVLLSFAHTDSRQTVLPPGPVVKKRVRHLILAMPRKSLEYVQMPYNEQLQEHLLPAVTPQPMFKFFVGYHFPWWRTLGLKSGRSITDLPLRQIYYWGSNYDRFFTEAPEKTGGIDNHPQNSLLMSYLDGRDVSFWKPLFELLGYTYAKLQAEAKSQASPDGAPAEPPHRQEPMGILTLDGLDSPAIEHLVGTIQGQLATIHGLSYIPRPYTLGFADWSAYPFGGGWNSWNPGYKAWKVGPQILKPYPELPVYICGEAYSTKQGWVEGAFETAEQVLQLLGLAQPDWLPNGYKPGLSAVQ